MTGPQREEGGGGQKVSAGSDILSGDSMLDWTTGSIEAVPRRSKEPAKGGYRMGALQNFFFFFF